MNRKFAIIISVATALLIILIMILSVFRSTTQTSAVPNPFALPTTAPVNRGFGNGHGNNQVVSPTLEPAKQAALFNIQKVLPYNSDAMAVGYSTLTNKIYIEKKNDKADEELNTFLVTNNFTNIYNKYPLLFKVVSSSIGERLSQETETLTEPVGTNEVASSPTPTPNPNDPSSQALPMMNVFKSLMGFNITLLPYSPTTNSQSLQPSQQPNQTTGTQIPVSSGELTTAQIGSFKLRGQQYDWGPYSCLNPPGQQLGAKAIQTYVNSVWGGGAGYIGNCGQSNGKYGIHAEGRAVDSFFNAGLPEELKKGNEAFGWLITNAANIGLQYAKYWRVQWTPYDGVYCVDNVNNGNPHDQSIHYSHIHYELNWLGAKQQTAFFTQGANNQSTTRIDQNICPQLEP